MDGSVHAKISLKAQSFTHKLSIYPDKLSIAYQPSYLVQNRIDGYFFFSLTQPADSFFS
jgi:hypothetical protein